MATLYEKITGGGMKREELLDVALSLGNLISEGKCPCILDPEDLLLDEEGNVSFRENPGNSFTFAPPEVVLEGQKYGEEAMLYSLGMLLDFMENRRDYFTRVGRTLIEVMQQKEGPTVIQAGETADELGRIAAKLTAFTPAYRQAGMREFLIFLGNIPGRIRVRYLCGARCVGEQEQEITSDLEEFPPGGAVQGSDGRRYRPVSPVRIPYRPGFHTYEVKVEPAGPAGGRADAQADELWLYVYNSLRDALMPIMKLGEPGQKKEFLLKNQSIAEWRFYFVKRNNGTKRAETLRDFTMKIPEAAQGRQVYLDIQAGKNGRDVKIRLLDETRSRNLLRPVLEVKCPT